MIVMAFINKRDNHDIYYEHDNTYYSYINRRIRLISRINFENITIINII